MKKSDVLEIIERRISEQTKIRANPDCSRSVHDEAVGAWAELISLQVEIEKFKTCKKK